MSARRAGGCPHRQERGDPAWVKYHQFFVRAYTRTPTPCPQLRNDNLRRATQRAARQPPPWALRYVAHRWRGDMIESRLRLSRLVSPKNWARVCKKGRALGLHSKEQHRHDRYKGDPDDFKKDRNKQPLEHMSRWGPHRSQLVSLQSCKTLVGSNPRNPSRTELSPPVYADRQQ